MNRSHLKLSLVLLTTGLTLFGFNNCLRTIDKESATTASRTLGTETGNPMSPTRVAHLPKVYLSSNLPALPLHHQILTVGKDKMFNDCQPAIDAANPGDEVVVDAGYVCSPIQLQAKGPSENYIVIRSSQLDQLLPEGLRLRESDAKHLAVIETNIDDYAVYFAESSHHYFLAGLEIRLNPNFSGIHRGLISIGPWNIIPITQIPRSITFSRTWIHGHPLQEILSGIRLNGSAISIVDSIINEIHAHDESSVAIIGWKMGAGPFKIVNNDIAAAGGSLALGGYTTDMEQTPSDIEFRKNLVHKPLAWRSPITSLAGLKGPWRSGSLLNLGNAKRILINGNIFENQWVDMSGNAYGYAIEFSPEALFNTPSIEKTEPRVSDITFTNNIIRNAAGAFNIIYQNFDDPSANLQRVDIFNNLIYNIGTEWGESLGVILLRQNAQGPVVFDHNTILNVEGAGPQLLNPWSAGSYSYFTFTNNLCSDQGEGIKDSNHPTGSATLLSLFPDLKFFNNVLAGQNIADYRSHSDNNFFPISLSAIGFVGQTSTDFQDYHNYRLSPTSPYLGKATDKTNIGADLNLIDAAMK